MAPPKWAEKTASALALREQPDPAVIYEDESQYSYITVRRLSSTIDKRAFMEDKLTHSIILMDDILNLQYAYEQIYAAVTRLTSGNMDKLSVFAIGGGGYVFPRYIEKVWPGSRIDVAEIDPRVTEAAIRAFGLDKNTSINTFAMDARNYVDELLYKKRTGGQIPKYDFIYEDAINDYSVPYQLTTKEFNDKISQLLTDDGVYMINLIDTYNSGLFLGAIIKTLQQTFPHIYIVTKEVSRQSTRGTFIIVSSMREINLENLKADPHLWILDDSEIETLKKRGRGIILTDDYVPVENMLAPVVRESATGSLPDMYLERAEKFEREGKLYKSLKMYKKVIKLDPAKSIMAYNNMVKILAKLGKWQEAIDAAKNAIKRNENLHYSVSHLYYNISIASKILGRDKDASEYMNKAIEAYRVDLAQEPNSTETLRNLGKSLMEIGRHDEACEYLQHAVTINPLEVQSYLWLADALSNQQKYDEAIAVIKKAIVSFSDARDESAVTELQRRLWAVEDSKKTNKK